MQRCTTPPRYTVSDSSNLNVTARRGECVSCKRLLIPSKTLPTFLFFPLIKLQSFRIYFPVFMLWCCVHGYTWFLTLMWLCRSCRRDAPKTSEKKNESWNVWVMQQFQAMWRAMQHFQFWHQLWPTMAFILPLLLTPSHICFPLTPCFVKAMLSCLLLFHCN